jgi:hypothetical protein
MKIISHFNLPENTNGKSYIDNKIAELTDN